MTKQPKLAATPKSQRQDDLDDLLRVQLESLGDDLRELAWEHPENLETVKRDAEDLAWELLGLVNDSVERPRSKKKVKAETR